MIFLKYYMQSTNYVHQELVYCILNKPTYTSKLKRVFIQNLLGALGPRNLDYGDGLLPLPVKVIGKGKRQSAQSKFQG